MDWSNNIVSSTWRLYPQCKHGALRPAMSTVYPTARKPAVPNNLNKVSNTFVAVATPYIHGELRTAVDFV